ncbi:sugar phosphate isomerase/epimerase [bacterium]|nr:sugar phosphate isomerase/epimerase [bacterium]
MKFGLNSLLWTGSFSNETLDLIDKIADMGFDGAEITLIDLDLVDVQKTAERLKARGLECIACAIMTEDANPISSDPDVRKQAVKRLERCIEMADGLGARVLAGPLYAPVGYLVGRRRTEDEWGWCRDVLKEAAKKAQQYGITMALECLNRFETFLLNTCEDTVRMCKDVGEPCMKVHFDTFHANIEEKNVTEAARNTGEFLGHFHASENDRGMIGSGHINYPEVFGVLKEIGYDEWIVIEAFGSSFKELAAACCIWRDLVPDPDVLAREGLKYVKGIIAA